MTRWQKQLKNGRTYFYLARGIGDFSRSGTARQIDQKQIRPGTVRELILNTLLEEEIIVGVLALANKIGVTQVAWVRRQLRILAFMKEVTIIHRGSGKPCIITLPEVDLTIADLKIEPDKFKSREMHPKLKPSKQTRPSEIDRQLVQHQAISPDVAKVISEVKANENLTSGKLQWRNYAPRSIIKEPIK